MKKHSAGQVNSFKDVGKKQNINDEGYIQVVSLDEKSKQKNRSACRLEKVS